MEAQSCRNKWRKTVSDSGITDNETYVDIKDIKSEQALSLTSK